MSYNVAFYRDMRRLVIFALLSLTVCAILNPGNFGTIDTTRRLQVARWLRLGEPPVRPGDTEFGITGRNGVQHAWYWDRPEPGPGSVRRHSQCDGNPSLGRVGLDPVKQSQLAELLIAFLMQSFITFCTLTVAYEVLLSFGFTPPVSMAGALSLLFGTLYLQYVQFAAENNLMLLLALCALRAIRRWQDGGGVRWAALAGLACGLAILIRLPCLLETGVLFLFAISARGNRKQFLAGFLPPLAAAFLVDRWYQWYRFGSWFNTYMTYYARRIRPPGAPPDISVLLSVLEGVFRRAVLPR